MARFAFASLLVCASICLSARAAAAEASKPVDLKVGDAAPAFEGVADDDQPWKSTDVVGKKFLVVYFYPADMTGGCTMQACGDRDALADLKRDDVEVVGVSGDSPESHRRFKEEHDLNFTLLADPKGTIAKAFGVKTAPGGKVNATFKSGETVELVRGVTAMRWTFVIGKDGKILDKDPQVDAPQDAARVLAAIEKAAAER